MFNSWAPLVFHFSNIKYIFNLHSQTNWIGLSNIKITVWRQIWSNNLLLFYFFIQKRIHYVNTLYSIWWAIFYTMWIKTKSNFGIAFCMNSNWALQIYQNGLEFNIIVWLNRVKYSRWPLKMWLIKKFMSLIWLFFRASDFKA